METASITTVLLFLLAAMAVCLLTLVLRVGRPHPARKDISVTTRGKSSMRNVPTPSPKIYTGTASLINKIDSRRRIMDEHRHTTIYDEYFELIFQLQDGEMLRLSCSKVAYLDVPFRTAGTVTYCNGRLLKFKSAEIAVDEYVAV